MSSEWSKFAKQFSGDARVAKNQFTYALPRRLCDSIRKHAKRFLTAKDFEFEVELRKAAGTGFWKGQPFFSRVLDTPHIDSDCIHRVPRDQQDGALKWSDPNRFWDDVTNDRDLTAMQKTKLDRIQRQILARAKGYSGWVVTSDLFIADLADFFARTGNHISKTPLASPHLKESLPQEVHGVVATLSTDLLTTWALDRVVTPHLVEPTEPILSNAEGVPRSEFNRTGVTLHVPWTFLGRPQLPLHEVMDLQSFTSETPHLTDWIRPKGKMGHQRYGRILDLYIYLHLALVKRYPDQIEGNQESLDRAFAAFWAGDRGDKNPEPAWGGVRALRAHLGKRLELCEQARLPEAIADRRKAFEKRFAEMMRS